MDVIGVISVVLAEIRAARDRVEKYRDGPEDYLAAMESLESLENEVKTVEESLKNSPNAVPAAFRAHFESTLEKVKENVGNCNEAMGKAGKRAFLASGSSDAASRLAAKVYRYTRGRSLDGMMAKVKAESQNASDKVGSLLSCLAITVKVDEVAGNKTNQEIEEYRSACNAPLLEDRFSLDFESTDDRGEFSTPEGALKDHVIKSASSMDVIAATGRRSTVYGALGMAGVGKTVALIGLAHDDDIKAVFPDGRWYMSLGAGARAEHVINAVGVIMKAAGARSSSERVASLTSLKDAISEAADWFRARTCLFLVDDIWPIEGECATGFLSDIKQLLCGSFESRLVVSTRSSAVAVAAGMPVDFGARAAQGAVSISIFRAHADKRKFSLETPANVFSMSEEEKNVLTLCSGLPIALAVSGCAVATLVAGGYAYDDACEEFAKDVGDGRSDLMTENDPGGRTLFAGIMASLRYLKRDAAKVLGMSSVGYTIDELYTSLSVLRNQQVIPVTVLARMWRLDVATAKRVAQLLSSASLAKTGGRGDEVGVQLHDLQLSFCKKQATGDSANGIWHRRLLDGHLPCESHLLNTCHVQETNSLIAVDVLTSGARQWWKEDMVNQKYIMDNVVRHLWHANLNAELEAVVLDVRWLHRQGREGGYLAIEGDFEYLKLALTKMETSTDEACSAVDLILKAIRVGSVHLCEGLREKSFALLSWLLESSMENKYLETVLNKIRVVTPQPFLNPVSMFSPLHTELEAAIPAGSNCLACSPCGRFIAVGTRNTVSISDARSLAVVKVMEGQDYVGCVTFGRTAAEVVSGSAHGAILVWDWQQSDSPLQQLSGHSDWVWGVEFRKQGHEILSWSDDKTVRFWDISTGAQTGMISENCEISSFAIGPSGCSVTVGLRNGTVKVYDFATRRELCRTENAHRRNVSSVAFSKDGNLLASSSWDGTIRLWDTGSWKAITDPLKGHADIVTCITFNSSGDHVFSGSNDCTIRRWSVANRQCVGISPLFDAVIWHLSCRSDTEQIISSSIDGVVRIWNPDFSESFAEKDAVFGPKDGVRAVAICRENSVVASAFENGTVQLWNAENGSPIGMTLEGLGDERIKRGFGCVDLSANGTRVVAGAHDGTVWLWETRRGIHSVSPMKEHTGPVTSVAFSWDGQRIISGGADETVRLWDTEKRVSIGEPLLGHQSSVTSSSETRDGTSIISRDGAGETIIWNYLTRAIVWRSKNDDERFLNSLPTDEVMEIILSCGQQSPYLWPDLVRPYPGDVFCRNQCIYSQGVGGSAVLGTLLPEIVDWKYDGDQKVFVAGLKNGAVALCKLVV